MTNPTPPPDTDEIERIRDRHHRACELIDSAGDRRDGDYLDTYDTDSHADRGRLLRALDAATAELCGCGQAHYCKSEVDQLQAELDSLRAEVERYRRSLESIICIALEGPDALGSALSATIEIWKEARAALNPQSERKGTK